jgi:hypothetical protein
MYLPWLAACEATRREKRILDDLLAHARKVHGPVRRVGTSESWPGSSRTSWKCRSAQTW